MPYKIRFYPKGVKKRSLLRKMAKPGAISVSSEATWPSKQKAKNSKLYKTAFWSGYSPRVEKVRRKK
jgi:hypothetical protein